ncbi:MAG: AI-2E family transporter [Microbacterium sp.]
MSEERRPKFRNPFRAEQPAAERAVTVEADEQVPMPLRITAAYGWRLLVIAAVAAVFVWLVIQLKLLVVPLMVGILITALLWPAFNWMLRRGVPRWLAVVISLLGTLGIIAGLFTLVVWQVRAQLPEVKARTQEGFTQLQVFLQGEPFNLTEKRIEELVAQAQQFLGGQSSTLWTGALGVATETAQVFTGLVLALFILICLLFDGAGIWSWTVKLFPRKARTAVDFSARSGWQTIVNYARTQLFVAAIDAIGIGLGAFLLGVPMAIPVAVLVFLGSFVPIVGAVVTGTIAVFLALVYNGIWIAVAMLGVVLLVQQVEGHILQPIMMGSAVKVHPLAVVLVVAGGAMVGGIPGALFAVPLAAFVNVFAVTASSKAWKTGEQPDADLIWSTVPRERRRRNR